MAITSTPIFSPRTEQVSEILCALTSATRSFTEVAEGYHTTPAALSAWMHRPDILEQLLALDSLTAFRTQLIARSLLPSALAACSEVITQFNRREEPAVPTAAPEPESRSKPADPLRAAIVRIRTFESVRKCATLILHLTKPLPRTTLPSQGGMGLPAHVSGTSPEVITRPPESPRRPHPAQHSGPVSRGTNIFTTLPTAASNRPSPQPASSPHIPPQPSTTVSPFPSPRMNLSPLDLSPALGKHRQRSTASLLIAAGASTSEHWP